MSIVHSRWNESCPIGAVAEVSSGAAYLRYDFMAEAFVLGVKTNAGSGEDKEIHIPNYIIKDIQDAKLMYHGNKNHGDYPWE